MTLSLQYYNMFPSWDDFWNPTMTTARVSNISALWTTFRPRLKVNMHSRTIYTRVKRSELQERANAHVNLPPPFLNFLRDSGHKSVRLQQRSQIFPCLRMLPLPTSAPLGLAKLIIFYLKFLWTRTKQLQSTRHLRITQKLFFPCMNNTTAPSILPAHALSLNFP